MTPLSQEDITRLISSRKIIVQAPRKEMKLERGSYRNDFTLESEDGQHRFSAFARRNAEFPENFSIGLRYHSPEGVTFTLLRCNGPHGQHVDLQVEPDSHFLYHIHEATAERVNEGNLSERAARETDGYATYDEALGYFIRAIRIVDADKHFPPHITQLSLFEPEGE